MRSHGYFIPEKEAPPALPGGVRWITARFGFEITGDIEGDGKAVPAAPAVRVMTAVATDYAALRDLVCNKVAEIVSLTPNDKAQPRSEAE